MYQPMNEQAYIQLNRTMPVPILEDSDIESNLSNEDSGHFTEMANPLTPPMARGAAEDVKQELQKAIRCRRVAQGLNEMPTLEAKRPNNQLSPAELEKRRLRRERNKLAAFKCRQRRKEHMQALEDETEVLNTAKRKVEAEIMALKDKKKELEDMLKSHDCIISVNSSDDEESKTSK